MRAGPGGVRGERDRVVHRRGADMDDDGAIARRAGHRRLDDRLALLERLQHAFAGRAAHVDAMHAGCIEASRSRSKTAGANRPASSNGVTSPAGCLASSSESGGLRPPEPPYTLARGGPFAPLRSRGLASLAHHIIRPFDFRRPLPLEHARGAPRPAPLAAARCRVTTTIVRGTSSPQPPYTLARGPPYPRSRSRGSLRSLPLIDLFRAPTPESPFEAARGGPNASLRTRCTYIRRATRVGPGDSDRNPLTRSPRGGPFAPLRSVGSLRSLTIIDLLASVQPLERETHPEAIFSSGDRCPRSKSNPIERSGRTSRARMGARAFVHDSRRRRGRGFIALAHANPSCAPAARWMRLLDGGRLRPLSRCRRAQKSCTRQGARWAPRSAIGDGSSPPPPFGHVLSSTGSGCVLLARGGAG